MSDIPVIYFNGARSKTAGTDYSIELLRSNNLTESKDVVAILYMDVFTAFSVFDLLKKDLEVYSEVLGIPFPEIVEKLQQKMNQDQSEESE